MDLEQIALNTAALPFCQRLTAFMDYRNWNAQRFTKHTGLDATNFSKIKNDKRKRLDMRTAVAIFVGLRLPLPAVEDLLCSAGMALSNSKEDRAYRYVILVMHGAGIHECNELLVAHGVPPLGSISKDDQVPA
jgi:hypothetical protein